LRRWWLATIPERQYPIADKSADAKVRHETKAGASRDLASKPTRDQSDQQNDK
jgi:hypothetical protein